MTLHAGRTVLLAALFVAVALLGSVWADGATTSFLTVGNWGDDTATQHNVAAAMSRVATTLGPSFVVSTGDNFLPAGVANAIDVRFANTWGNVYNSSALQVPWHVVLGDRDHTFVAGVDMADAQVSYSNSNARWKCGPTPVPTSDLKYFKTEQKLLDATHYALFVFIDTYKLDAAAEGSARDALYQWVENQLQVCPPLVVGDPNQSSPSNCLWLFVVGHHPLFSAGENALLPSLQQRLLPLLQQYQVDAYFSSHDASLQHFTSSRMELFVAGSAGGASTGAIQLSGANTANWYPPVSASGAVGASPLRFASLSHGFTAHTVAVERINTTFYDAAGSALYTHAAYPRRAFGTGGYAPVTAGEKVVLAMCWVFVLAISLAIAVKSYLQKRADELAAKQAKAAHRVSSGAGGRGGIGLSSGDHLGSGAQSAIAIAGDGKFEQMDVVASTGPTVDSKADAEL